jgi:hypothetical protein
LRLLQLSSAQWQAKGVQVDEHVPLPPQPQEHVAEWQSM